ncbi:uncharacterized protein LOC121375472 [Gigantopelta aegis]|uniref:uncharacterized protein LOC121375472 n=1 Tax=Gigantopelta aegis TaxID=1735272 RepID=UPI001B88D7EA|nr:uncharacterized protein LOC121375472 [Gigantopelta aegis]
MNQSKKINFWYKDHIVVKVWEGNSLAYVHFNKITKTGTKSLTFCSDAIRALLDNKEQILSAIDDVEREYQEEREMLALDVTDERMEQQQQQQHYHSPPSERVPLNATRRFQPYVGSGGGNFEGRGLPTNMVLGQGRGAPSTNLTLSQGLGAPFGRGRGSDLLAVLQHQQQQQISINFAANINGMKTTFSRLLLW